MPKEYPDVCIIKSLDQKLIIMIIYDKNIFSANNRNRKGLNLNSQGILQPK